MKPVSSDNVPPGGMLPPAATEVLDCGIGWIWLQDGVIRVRLRPNVDMSLDDAKEMIAASEQLQRSLPVRMLTDIGTARRGSTVAREYLAGPEATAAFTAVAHLIPSPVARVLMSAWMRLQKPPYPTQLFPPERIEDALAWLAEQRTEPPSP